MEAERRDIGMTEERLEPSQIGTLPRSALAQEEIGPLVGSVGRHQSGGDFIRYARPHSIRWESLLHLPIPLGARRRRVVLYGQLNGREKFRRMRPKFPSLN